MTKQEEPGIYGVIAEFDDPNAVVAAARKTYDAGYRRINAYSPYPIEELSEAIGYNRNYVSLTVLIFGIMGGLGGFALQVWTSAIAYPLNIGGRPLISMPSFIPITFECTVLLGALAAFIGMVLMNRLPQPYHPVFNVPAFSRASQDRFFLCIKADDPKFSTTQTRSFLESLGAKTVSEVDE
jgi:ActD protein